MPITIEALRAGAGLPPEETTDPLASYRVDHTRTLGFSWKEIDALRPPAVIEGFVRQGELMLLGAESKGRKSWLVQDAGFCVAAGLPWLADEEGEGGFATTAANVHVIDLELSRTEIAYRFAKARANRFADAPELQRRVTEAMHSYCLDGLNVLDVLPILERIKPTVQPGDLVILDCFYRLVADGNETNMVAAMLESLKRFALETSAALIVVDHFRKAGDDKARNRFAGSFVKQASASTLVAIETRGELLDLRIDARTFHGMARVFARFDLDRYAFQHVSETEVETTRAGAKQSRMAERLVALWKAKPLDAPVTVSDAVEKWGIARQNVMAHLNALVEEGLLRREEGSLGKAHHWHLTASGARHVREMLNLHASCGMQVSASEQHPYLQCM